MPLTQYFVQYEKKEEVVYLQMFVASLMKIYRATERTILVFQILKQPWRK